MCNYCHSGFPEFALHEAKALCSSEKTPTTKSLEDKWAALFDEPAEQESRELSDTISAGRKRAARKHHILDGEGCAWAGLKYAGGGIHPIVACRDVEEKHAVDLHHGPDKSTQNNDDDNVHKICKRCHNRWHQLNDGFYGIRPKDNSTYLPKEEFMEQFKPHDRETLATEEDFIATEKYWAGRKLYTAKDEE